MAHCDTGPAMRRRGGRRATSTSVRTVLLAAAALAAAAPVPAFAGVRAEWSTDASIVNGADPGTLDYNADGNWDSNDTPPTQARFGYTANPHLSFSKDSTSVGQWLFRTPIDGAPGPTPDYTITIGNGQTFTFDAEPKVDGTILETGIVMNGGNLDLVNNGTLNFRDATSAHYAGPGKVVIENNGVMDFSDTADGGNARIVNGADASFQIENLTSPGMQIGSIEGGGTFSLGDKTLIVGGNDLSTEVSGSITGVGGSLTKVGTGTLTLSGNNSYSGATTIEGGTVKLGADNALGTGGLDIAAGSTFDMWGFNQTVTSLDGDAGSKVTTLKPITLTGSPPTPVLSVSTLTVNGGGDFAGVIENGAGFMSLTKNGSGTLTLSGVNDYSGTTTVNGGILALAGDGSIESSASLQLNTNTLDISQTNDGARIRAIIAFPGGGINLGTKTLTLTGENFAGSSIIYGGISGDGGGLTITGGASVELNAIGSYGDNTYTGATTIEDGTLQLRGSASIAESSTVDIEEDGTFDLTSAFDTSVKSIEGEGLIHLGSKTLTITDANTTFSGTITDIVVSIGPDGPVLAAGNGKLALTGGTLTLTGENTFSGGTDIEGGTLLVGGNDTSIGQGTVTMAAGTTLGFVTDGLDLHNTFKIAGDPTFDVGGTFTETVSGDIGDDDPANPGVLEKTGTGTLILSGDNTYTGGSTIVAGTVEVGSSTAFGTGDVAMADGTTLGFGTDAAYDLANDFALSGTGTVNVDQNSGPEQTISGEIADGSSPGSLSKTGDGTLILSGTNTYTGATTIESGTLALSGDGSIAESSGVFVGLDDTGAFDITQTNDGASIKTLSGNGIVYIDGKTLTVTDASTTFDGVFFDGGTLGLTGGTLTLNGRNFIDQTNVGNATLVVGDAAGKHAVDIGTIDVDSGGTIAGHGEVGDLNLRDGATVAPGSLAGAGEVIGTLTANGDVTFDAGASYAVDVDPAGSDSDLLHVTGIAHLGDASVVHVGLDGTYDIDSTYKILTADGGLDGAFQGATSDFLFLDPSLTYDDDNVYLQLARNDIAFDDPAQTPNENATGSSIEKLGRGDPLYDAILGITGGRSVAAAAFDSLSGEIHASLKGVLIDDSRFVREAALDRLRAAFGVSGAPGTPVLAAGEDGGVEVADTTPPPKDGAALWTRSFGNWAQSDGDGNAADLTQSTGGVLVGLDGQPADHWRAGALAGFGRSRVDVGSGRASSAESDDYHVAVFGGGQWGGLGLRGGAAYTWHSLSTDRDVAFAGFTDHLSADYGAGTAQLFGELAYDVDAGAVGLEPFADLAYVNLTTQGVVEQGGDAALAVAGDTTAATFTTVGLRVASRMPLGNATATLRGTVGWRHAFGDTTPLAGMAFAAGDAFTIAGVPIASDAALVEAGVDLDLAPGATIGVSYQGQFTAGQNENALDATLKVAF